MLAFNVSKDAAMAHKYPQDADIGDIDAINMRNIASLGIHQIGAIVASAAIHRAIGRKAIYAVKSWQGARAPVRYEYILDCCDANGWRCEAQFDAAHGRRYRLAIYVPIRECRNATLLA